jgi:hypothetical protein
MYEKIYERLVKAYEMKPTTEDCLFPDAQNSKNGVCSATLFKHHNGEALLFYDGTRIVVAAGVFPRSHGEAYFREKSEFEEKLAEVLKGERAVRIDTNPDLVHQTLLQYVNYSLAGPARQP